MPGFMGNDYFAVLSLMLFHWISMLKSNTSGTTSMNVELPAFW
jgi:hypothetical protein